MVKKKANSALRNRSRTKASMKRLPKATSSSSDPTDDMDLLSEALSRTLKAEDALPSSAAIEMDNSSSRTISKKKHNRAKRAAMRKVVKVKAKALARKGRRRAIARN